MLTNPFNMRYRIHDAINGFVYEHPDWADLHHPDNVKELARWLRDQGFTAPVTQKDPPPEGRGV